MIDAARAFRPSLALGSLALAQAAAAQSGPPASDEIIVTAAPPQQQTSIDRKTYLVRDNAQAQTQNATDVLRHVPSVTVNARDQVQLLGDSGVTVLIDGHPLSGGPNALKALPASQIAKVEVMTNPSAALTAEATGGIINIVTRRAAGAGLGGTASVAMRNFGRAEAKVAPTYGGENWSAALTLDLRNDLFRYDGARTRIAADPALAVDQVAKSYQDQAWFSSRGDFSYTPRAATKWSLSLSHDESNAPAGETLVSLSRGSDLSPISQITTSDRRFRRSTATIGYHWTGKRQGESLKISGHYDDVDNFFPGSVLARYDSGERRSDLFRDTFSRTAEMKLDYVHPMRKADTLSVGGALTHVDSGQANGVTGTAIFPSPVVPLTGRWWTIAGYATFQFPVGKWTMLPGLRAEQRIQDVGSLGVTGHREALQFFPSLHLDRKLAKRLDFAASYSRRVEWPTIDQLDPNLVYADTFAAVAGNPRLRPQLTDAFETSLAFTPGKQSLTLKLYDRETRDSFSYAVQSRPDGVLVQLPVNAGHASKRGGEIALTGPIWKGWHYSLSTDFAARHIQVADPFGQRTGFTQFAYSGNAQIEYQDRPDGKPGGNHIALESQYTGPTREYQLRTSSWMDLTLRWTHDYTKRLSTVIQAANLARGIRSDTTGYTSAYTEIDRFRIANRMLTVSLISKLGKVK